MKIKQLISILIISLWSSLVFAADSSPNTLLSQLSTQMISELKGKRLVFKQNHNAVNELVRRVLIPYADLDLMSKAVLGSYWKQATEQQKTAFKAKFTHIIIDTYATALAEYTNEKVVFLPSRDSSNQKTVRVDSKVLRQGAPTIPVSYRCVRNGDSWKVYDIIVDGVSLVQNYRSQFGGILRQGGMDNLLVAMAKHNG